MTNNLQELPSDFIKGMEHFNEGAYFEAHETWERIWLISEGEYKIFYQMLIQAAVALFHCSRGNEIGARSLFEASRKKLDSLPSTFMDIDLELFARHLDRFFSDLSVSCSTAPPEKPLLHLIKYQSGQK